MALPVQRHIQRRLFAVSDAEEAQHLPVKSGPIALITIIVVGYPVHPVHLFLLLPSSSSSFLPSSIFPENEPPENSFFFFDIHLSLPIQLNRIQFQRLESELIGR